MLAVAAVVAVVVAVAVAVAVVVIVVAYSLSSATGASPAGRQASHLAPQEAGTCFDGVVFAVVAVFAGVAVVAEVEDAVQCLKFREVTTSKNRSNNK